MGGALGSTKKHCLASAIEVIVPERNEFSLCRRSNWRWNASDALRKYTPPLHFRKQTWDGILAPFSRTLCKQGADGRRTTITGSRFTRNVSVVMKKFLTKYDCTRTGPVNACGVSVPFMDIGIQRCFRWAGC